MATIKMIIDVTAPDAQKAFDTIGARLTELDRSLQKNREIGVSDRDAAAKLARMQLAADRFGDRLKNMPLTIDGAKRAEATLLGLEAQADKLQDKLNLGVSTHKSLLTRAKGLFGGGAEGEAGAAGGVLSGALSGVGGAIPGLGGLLSTPESAVATLTAGIAALPFAAAAASGAMVSALGGGMAAVAVIFAAKNKQIQKDWAGLTGLMGKQLQSVSAPFVGVLHSAIIHLEGSLPTLMTGFGKGISAMASPLKGFLDTLADSLGRVKVSGALQAIGTAFGSILKALKPSIPSMIDSIAEGVTNVAQAISHHSGMFAAFIQWLADMIKFSLDVVSSLTRVAGWIVHAWQAGVGGVEKAYRTIMNWWHKLKAGEQSVLTSAGHAIAKIWDTTWNNTVGRAKSGISSVLRWVGTMPGRIKSLFSSAEKWLLNAGGNVVLGLLRGIKAKMSGIASWVRGNIVNPVVNWVKHFFGIHSPSTVMHGVGFNLIAGLFRGMMSHNLTGFVSKIFGSMPKALGSIVSKGLVSLESLPSKALSALSKIGGFFAHLFGGGGSAGGGVQRWAGLVAQALRMEGLSPGLLHNVLYQMQTESGGNPAAINLSDINARMGDPSRGLMQVIGSTFSAYHWPGTSRNIYDPLANIAAALNYARHTYGPSLMSGGMGIGSGHGYATGSWYVPATGPALVHKGEIVVPAQFAEAVRSAMGQGGDGVQVMVLLDGQAIEPRMIKVLAEDKRKTKQQVRAGAGQVR